MWRREGLDSFEHALRSFATTSPWQGRVRLHSWGVQAVGDLLRIRPAHDEITRHHEEIILSPGPPQSGSDIGSVYERKAECA